MYIHFVLRNELLSVFHLPVDKWKMDRQNAHVKGALELFKKMYKLGN